MARDQRISKPGFHLEREDNPDPWRPKVMKIESLRFSGSDHRLLHLDLVEVSLYSPPNSSPSRPLSSLHAQSLRLPLPSLSREKYTSLYYSPLMLIFRRTILILSTSLHFTPNSTPPRTPTRSIHLSSRKP
ncbi:hypothetical protein OIU76_006588 [Salix suchowensis]|nr:hypothetical protein OIU76_006588 [Salix suchowensis]